MNLDGAGGECGGASSVAELSNGNEGGIPKGREEMGGAGRGWKLGKVEVDLMGGDHDGMISEGDMEGGGGRAFVGVRGMDG